MGISNTFATIPGFVSPAIAGAITDGNVNLDNNFFFTSLIFVYSKRYGLGERFSSSGLSSWASQRLHTYGKSILT